MGVSFFLLTPAIILKAISTSVKKMTDLHAYIKKVNKPINTATVSTTSQLESPHVCTFY